MSPRIARLRRKGAPAGTSRGGFFSRRRRVFRLRVGAIGRSPRPADLVETTNQIGALKEKFTSVEVCAGAGGQALGLEQAGFRHVLTVDNDEHCIRTITRNRLEWNPNLADLSDPTAINPRKLRGVDLFAGGLPCPPFSKAGKQLGEDDERNLFPFAQQLIEQIDPKAVMIENVRGILDERFGGFRYALQMSLEKMGYLSQWQLLNASDYGVPQLRPRAIFVALKRKYSPYFRWPTPNPKDRITVGEALFELMSERGWRGAAEWSAKANRIAPTLVGGSKKHGGPDLGPTRAKREWEALGVNAHTLAEVAPDPDFTGNPRLTVRMAARVQGFPLDWDFVGSKTHAYRQVGNAFPPPVARAVGRQIALALQERFR